MVDKLLEVLEGREDVEALDVVEGGLKVGEEGLGAGVARLHLGEVVISNHAVDETSGELRGGEEVHLVGVSGLGDGTNSDKENVGSGLARLEVLLGSPVGLNSGDISGKLLPVEDHRLGNVLSDSLRVLEDGSPLSESLNLRAHVLASTEGGGDLTSDGLGEASSLDHVLGLNIFDKLLNLGHEFVSVSGAGLDLVEVVFANKTVEETAEELNGALNAGEGVGGLILRGRNGANSESEGFSGVLAGIEVLGGSPVGLLLGDISTDLAAVEKPVLANSLGEFGGLGEDLGPCLNGSDVVAHALAGGHGGADLVPDGTSILDALEVVAGLKVSNGDLGVSDDLVTTLVAGLNLGEVVVTGHAVHEAGNPVGDSLG